MDKLNYTIAVIVDDPILSKTITELLEERYSKVISYSDPAKATDKLYITTPDLVLLDLFLGHANGLDVLEEIRKLGHKMPVIMMTAFSDLKMAVRAMKLGAEDFVVKPIDNEQLEIAIEKALQNYDLKRQVEVMSQQLDEDKLSEIIGESKGLKSAMKMADVFAAADDTTVLILGESGTGKELMARFIHQNSPRAKGPFVTINCGAIPKDLAENELFGYEKGAFTGATEKFRKGKFEQAQHGTILFDEVGELTLDLQVKLLRVLEERKFYRLGGSKEVSVDVRVLTSTNKNLEKLVSEGDFREDLFYRLNVARIELPALKERDDDIMLLASHFIKEFNKKFGKRITGFSPEAGALMTAHTWPGNIRELRNCLERVCLLETEETISEEHLSFIRSAVIPKKSAKSDIEIEEGKHYLEISETGAQMGDVLYDLIHKTLKITGGNQIKAAKLLGISRAKLRYRIEQLGIPIPGKD